MKKFKLLVFSMLLAGAAFTSCSPDELLDVPELDKPVVTVFKDLDGQKVAITSINNTNAGEEMPVTVRFDMGAQKNRLERIKITTIIGNQPFVVLDSALNTGIFNRGDKMFERKYNIAVGQTISKLTFEAIDSKGVVGSTTVTVTPKGSVVPNVNRTVLLAGQLNTAASYGGFYSVALAKDYKLKDAVTNAPYIDFVYYYGSTDKATLAPISDNRLFEVGDIKDDIAEFVQRNATEFATATQSNWDANSGKGELPTASYVAVGQKNLAKGNVLAFKTKLGLNGLILVNEILGTKTDGSDRAIDITVKVIQ